MGFHTTYYGLEVDPADVRPRQITIGDIAQGLGNLCRFAGQCRTFYSVAQHSVMVSQLVPRELALAGLLHDAAEAYVADLPKPVKELVPEYRDIEDRIMGAVAERFALPWPLPPAIKEADMVALATEYRDLVPRKGTPWPCLEGVEPISEPIQALPPDFAADFFLARHHHLVGKEEGVGT